MDKYDIIGISSVTQIFDVAKLAIKKIKKSFLNWSSLIVLGGIHITTLPECLPEGSKIGVIGEGEKTFVNNPEIFLKDCTSATPGLMINPKMIIIRISVRNAVNNLLNQ